MSRIIHIVLVIVMFVFFFTPALTYACGKKSEKICCKKEMSSRGDKKDCCKKGNDSKNKSPNDACNGKCGHTNCIPSSFQFNLALFEFKFKNNNLVFNKKKQDYNYSETHISSGFYSIWLIPKIG